jgi:hypothetical protein
LPALPLVEFDLLAASANRPQLTQFTPGCLFRFDFWLSTEEIFEGPSGSFRFQGLNAGAVVQTSALGSFYLRHLRVVHDDLNYSESQSSYLFSH